MDAWESPSQAAIRELQEEVGITVEPDQLSQPYVAFYPSDDKTHERVSLFFTVKGYSGEPRNAEVHKADELLWCTKDALPDKLVPILHLALKDIEAGIPYSDAYYTDPLYRLDKF